MSKQEDFIRKILPFAKDVESIYGVPASIAIAQAALETGWGDKVKNNIMVGVKAGKSWNGPTADVVTHEIIDGVRTKVVAKFRVYDSVEASMRDYAKLLAESPRYAKAMQAGNAYKTADALQAAGYATDEQYAEKLKSIIASNNLTQFDDGRYQGYTEGARFETTRKRFYQQREANPEPWKKLMESIMSLVADVFKGITAMIFGGDSKPTPPLPTPSGARVAAVGNVPVRGA